MAINQLMANQVAIQQQMAAMTFAAPPPPPTRSSTSPPCRTWDSSHSQKQLRACSSRAKVVEAASRVEEEGDVRAVEEEEADAKHL